METPVPNSHWVRETSSAIEPRPSQIRGIAPWLRTNLFSSATSGAMTVALAIAVAYLGVELFSYFFTDAVWSSVDGTLCRADGVGACWSFIGAKIDYFRYGAYPLDQRWRVDATWALGAILIGRLVLGGVNRQWRRLFLLIVIVPLGSALAAPGLDALIARPFPDVAIFIAAALLSAGLLSDRVGQKAVALLFFVVYPITAFLLLHGSLSLGLPPVDTNLWGGLLVTLVVSVVGIVASVPGGIILALGRRSSMPAVRLLSTALIEGVRGVPLVAVLFMANTMLPLFVPEQFAPDRLLRPLIGVALFTSAYTAEVVRGGLQGIPKGQYEAAKAIGLGYWKMMARSLEVCISIFFLCGY